MVKTTRTETQSKGIGGEPRLSRLFSRKRFCSTIGIVHPCYGYERVSYALPTEGYEYQKLIHLPLNRLERKGTFLQYTPAILDASVDLVHTWNSLPIGVSPFVVSFENELPRYLGKSFHWQLRLGNALLASKRCRRILALSQTAADIAKTRFEAQGLFDIAAKVVVFRGGVNLGETKRLPRDHRALGDKAQLRAIFVGASAFPKGLVPAFRALDQLRKGGIDVSLTVVGGFCSTGYALRHLTPSPEHWAQKLHETHWVRHIPYLPNAELLQLLRLHDLLINPSLDESLGWIVVEAGLAGLPAIVTNVFALPELVKHEHSGFVINLSLGKQRRWRGIWAKDVELEQEVSQAYWAIERGVIRSIETLVNRPECVAQYGKAARKHMIALYDPRQAARQIESIYVSSIA